MTKTLSTVNIRPGVTVLSVLRHLNYRPWYALAEFVDNSIQSFLDYKDELEKMEGHGFKLRVSIELDPRDNGTLSIRDNAAGIHEVDFPRAFRPAEAPPDRSGMAEFGMGMKSAACWFANSWTVRTSALGEPFARRVHFDINKIVHDRIEELEVWVEPANRKSHFTEIVLSNLHRIPQGRTLSKIKQHLTSIYRMFFRQGKLRLFLDGEELTFDEVDTLTAPFYKGGSSKPVEWRKELKLDFGGVYRAHGFAALREKASTSEAGFALFRRNRLILGSGDEGYRPEAIFGKSNSFRFQRLFGELHLEGFEVTHTKDGFRWNEHEELFLELLEKELQAPPLPLLDQAEGYRARPKLVELKPAADLVTDRTAAVIEREIPPVIEQQLSEGPEKQDPPRRLSVPSQIAATREIVVDIRGTKWLIKIELSSDPSLGDWLFVSEDTLPGKERSRPRNLGVRVALLHPFMQRFAATDAERIEPLLRVAAALALAETTARASGVKYAATIRRNVNEYLRDALAKP